MRRVGPDVQPGGGVRGAADLRDAGIQLIFCLPVAGSMIGALVAGSTAGMPISMRHMRQLPTTESFGW